MRLRPEKGREGRKTLPEKKKGSPEEKNIISFSIEGGEGGEETFF